MCKSIIMSCLPKIHSPYNKNLILSQYTCIITHNISSLSALSISIECGFCIFLSHSLYSTRIMLFWVSADGRRYVIIFMPVIYAEHAHRYTKSRASVAFNWKSFQNKLYEGKEMGFDTVSNLYFNYVHFSLLSHSYLIASYIDIKL